MFVQTVKIIYEEMKDVKPEELESTLKNYFLVYDNMCHLDNLRAAKEDLPLSDAYKSIWGDEEWYRQVSFEEPRQSEM